jgi:replicative DNA helicase
MNDHTEAAGAPPHSIESEQAVLGALMRFNDSFDRIGDLQAKHFYREDHRAIYTEIVHLISHGQPADQMTVWAALQSRGGSFLTKRWMTQLE